MKSEGIQEASVNSGLCACWQVVNHLSQPPSPFYSAYFGDRVLLFAQAILDHGARILSFLVLLE
jgi:hypothetical protein